MNAPDSPVAPPASPLPAGLRHGYGAAAASLAIANTAVMFFLLWFLVDRAGLSPAAAGTVLLVGKVWDAVSDPLIGRLSDGTRSRFGRRRAWVAAGSLPFMLLFASLWWGLPFTGWLLVVAYAGLLVVYSTAYTAVVVPYGALTPDLTRDYDERTRLNAARMGWSMAGGMAAGILLPLVARRTGSWGLGAAMLAVLMIPGLVVMLRATRGRDLEGPPANAATGSMWSVLSNEAFRRTAVLFVLAWTSIATLSALVPFFVNHHLKHPGLLDAAFAAIQFSALLCIPLVAWLARKLDKARAYAVCIATWAVVLLGLAAVPSGTGVAALVVAALCGPGVAAAHVLPWSMLPDVVEADQVATGQDRAGAFYGVMTFLEKSATAVALWGVGVGLEVSGWVEGADVQPDGALRALLVMIGPVPAVALTVAVVLALLRPPMGREVHRALVDALAQPDPSDEVR